MNEAARVRWDEGRREPRSGTGREAADPLAELARLVGQDDPYRKVFRTEPPARQEDWRDYDGEAHGHEAVPPAHDDPSVHAPSAEAWHPTAEPAHDAGAGETGTWDGHGDAYAHGDGYGHHDGYADEQSYAEDGGYRHPEAQPYADDERYYAVEAASHHDDAGIPDATAASAAIPDVWAAGHDGPMSEAAAELASSRPPESGTARRPLLVLAAVLVLTGGGLAASFLAKGGSSATVVAANANGAPTILAATGPTKIKQEDPSATAPEDKDAALLSKGAATAAGPAKVVHSEEQPTDLSQLPNAEPGTAQAAAPGPFPEAKKVRTFVVHPDGTPIYDDGQSVGTTAAAAPAPQTPAAGATPRATGAGVATPPSPTIASLAADPAPPPVEEAAPAPAPSPAVAPPAPKRESKPKPAAGARTGSFGLQLAASPSEAEANAAFARLKKKYPSELGSLVANVHQSDTGGKPVYRVRVGGMSREDAGALCSKLMAGGGSCFVVHD